ncbi:MAG: carboxypeptidase-like regulatory domain-containing protein, partial [Ginsengibacter sp.]
MRKLLFFLLCVRVFNISAQKIEGTVYDEEGKRLPFASVLIKGTPQGVTANNDGRFSFALPAGNYTLVCMHVGYTSEQKNITLVSGDVTVNFNLSQQKLVLKEIIIKQNGEDPAYEIIRQAI